MTDFNVLAPGATENDCTEIQEVAGDSVAPRRKRKSYINTVVDPVSGAVRHYFRPATGTRLPNRCDRRLPDDADLALQRAQELAALCVSVDGPGVKPTELLLQERIAGVVVDVVTSARKRAKRKGLPFDLTNQYVLALLAAQNHVCAVSGLPFSAEKDRSEDFRASHRPSLDRLDPGLGYVPGNVRLVLVAVNIALGEWGDVALLRLCRAIIKTASRTPALSAKAVACG